MACKTLGPVLTAAQTKKPPLENRQRNLKQKPGFLRIEDQGQGASTEEGIQEIKLIVSGLLKRMEMVNEMFYL